MKHVVVRPAWGQPRTFSVAPVDVRIMSLLGVSRGATLKALMAGLDQARPAGPPTRQGNTYNALRSLLDRGMVARDVPAASGRSGPPAHLWRLTDLGEHLLEAERAAQRRSALP